MWNPPKKGKHDDKAHPPIHPVKNASKDKLSDSEWKIYELLSRHFLATISKDAIGSETSITANMSGEIFHCKGITVEQLNWLEVFNYEKWSETVLPKFFENQTFKPSKLEMVQGETTPPKHLTESDLITLMDKNGIGTDATIHEHIKNV